jgi:hypothetical protein
MTWFKSTVRISSRKYIHFNNNISEGHIRFILARKYGNSISTKALVEEIKGEIKPFEVTVFFKYLKPFETLKVLAINEEHVETMLYLKYSKKEISKIKIWQVGQSKI